MSRGIRNHNPGNIRHGAKWQGLAARHEMTNEQKREREFAVFRSPEWGIRAIVKIIQTYERKYSIDTVRGIIERWAPPFENDTGSYIARVANDVGAGPDEPLNLADSSVLMALIKSIINHENANEQPYSDATILAGVALAGVKSPKRKPLLASKRLAGGTMVGGAVTVLTQIQDVVSAARIAVASVIPDAANPNTGWYLAAVLGAALAAFGLYIGWTILMDYMGQNEPEAAER